MVRVILICFAAVCLIVHAVTDICAEDKKYDEYKVKAAFIYQFINFIEWPPTSQFNNSSSINLCIIGDDPFGNAIDEMRSETIKGKQPMIKRYRNADETGNCHIIFISASEKNSVGHILKAARKTAVLTVSDSEALARKGAIISFFIEQKKVRFLINTEAVRQSGLKFSAKLLRLARIGNVIED